MFFAAYKLAAFRAWSTLSEQLLAADVKICLKIPAPQIVGAVRHAGVTLWIERLSVARSVLEAVHNTNWLDFCHSDRVAVLARSYPTLLFGYIDLLGLEFNNFLTDNDRL